MSGPGSFLPTVFLVFGIRFQNGAKVLFPQFSIMDSKNGAKEPAPSQPAEAEGSPHPTVSQQPALSSQQSPRTLLSTESDTAYVTGLGYDGTSSPSSPAGVDGSAVLQAGELPSSGVT